MPIKLPVLSSTRPIAPVLLVAGLCVAGSAFGSASDPPTASETTPAKRTAPASTVAWNAESGKMMSPDDHGMAWVADEMRRLFAERGAALAKAGLLEVEKGADGNLRLRVDPGLFTMSLTGPLGTSDGPTCSQIHDEPAPAADVAPAPSRPRSTASTEGWVTQ